MGGYGHILSKMKDLGYDSQSWTETAQLIAMIDDLREDITIILTNLLLLGSSPQKDK